MSLDTNTQESFFTVLHPGSLFSPSKTMFVVKMSAPQFSVLYNDILQRIPQKTTCSCTQSAQRSWNLFFFFLLLKVKGLTGFLYLILSFQLTEPLCTAGYNIILENQMGSIQNIFLPYIFIGIFHYIKQLPVCLFHLAPLTSAGTIHSKGKAIAHVPVIPVTWMFAP